MNESNFTKFKESVLKFLDISEPVEDMTLIYNFLIGKLEQSKDYEFGYVGHTPDRHDPKSENRMVAIFKLYGDIYEVDFEYYPLNTTYSCYDLYVINVVINGVLGVGLFDKNQHDSLEVLAELKESEWAI